jgi:hypothetical protein
MRTREATIKGQLFRNELAASLACSPALSSMPSCSCAVPSKYHAKESLASSPVNSFEAPACDFMNSQLASYAADVTSLSSPIQANSRARHVGHVVNENGSAASIPCTSAALDGRAMPAS